nr:hypothetical protein [Aquabacterium sp. J223]
MSRSVSSTRWAWIVGTVAVAGFGLVLAFVLSFAQQEHGFYERHFLWLFWLNVAIAAVLALVIAGAAVRLAVRMRQGKFGSRLLLKLAGIFALVGVLPGVLIYTVSYQFVTRSIEAWFDVQVAGALNAGLSLGRDTLDNLVTEVAGKTRSAAERLGDNRLPPSALQLERLREQLAASELSVVSSAGQVLMSAGGSTSAFPLERPATPLLRQARANRSASQLEGLDDEPVPAGGGGTVGGGGSNARVRALALIPSSELRLDTEDRFLMVVQQVPPVLAANALAVQAAYREYQQRALAREGCAACTSAR